MKNKNRKYIGFEIDKTYYEIAKRRVEEAYKLKAGEVTNEES